VMASLKFDGGGGTRYSHNILSPFKERGEKLWVIFYLQSSNATVSKLHKYEWSEREERKMFLFLENVGFPFDHQAKM
jgi:hypothetical protein